MMKWSDEYQIGLPVIDSQHKRLFNLIDELNKAIETGPEITDIEELLAGLKQYATRHFQLEEKYMVESNYPGLEEQQKDHAYFTNRFKALNEEINEIGFTPAVAQVIKEELSEWLKEHVTGLDVNFGEYCRQQE
jgi:hemerythrin